MLIRFCPTPAETEIQNKTADRRRDQLVCNQDGVLEIKLHFYKNPASKQTDKSIQ